VLKILLKILIPVVLSSLWLNPLYACTDVRLTAKDGTLIVARSMEFGINLNSNLRSSTRERQYITMMPDGKAAMTWKDKLGYLYVDGFDQDIAIDGINEAGLTFEYLYLPGETQYQDVPQGKENHGIPYFLFGNWVLGNFKTADEVRKAMESIYVYAETMPGMGNVIFPGHVSIFDAKGKGIVIEFIKGKAVIHDNIGVMTNSPTYDWQVANLSNYLNLTPYNPAPITANGLTFAATGQGAGMLGLPGDVSPPSRFVKVAFMAKVSYPVADATALLNLAQHFLNNVDIPDGLARAHESGGKESSDITEWVLFKDITHKIMYYRTYNDMTLRSVDMNKIDFSPNAKRYKMSLVQAPYVMDNTQKFLHSKNN
jgi:choloylglycine hydrolase